ncbi:MAG TPA: hypothetical protein PK867_28200, partial [Pirellulales bacterium]|nr:hypothetical protein [Pirellulales bacterium]
MAIASLAATWPLAIVIQPRSASAAEPTSPQANVEAVGTLPSPITLAQFQQAAQIAKLAAEHGMHELSQRAMREALANGPPLNLQAMPGLGQPKPRVRVSRFGGGRGSVSSPFKVESEVAQTLFSLAEPWKRHSPAEDVYQTLAAIVLPERRPLEIFLYDIPSPSQATDVVEPTLAGGAVSSAGPVSVPLRSWVARNGRLVPVVQMGPIVGRLLVNSAEHAGRVDDPKQKIASRDGEHAEFGAAVLLAQLAIVGGHFDAAACWPHLEKLAKHDPPVYASQLLQELAIGINGPDMPAEMVAWLERRLADDTAQSRRIADDETWLKLLLALARRHLANGNAEQARRHLWHFARFQVAEGAAVVVEPGAKRWLRVCREFSRVGLLDDALEALARHADAKGGSSRETLLTPAWLKVRQLLLDHPHAEERYQRLVTWTMPASDGPQLRFVGCFVPHDHRPAVFQTALSRSWPDDDVASNFDVLVSAAREAGRLDELKERLAAYSTADSVEAVALEVLVARELGETDGLRTRIERWLAAQQAAAAEPAPAGQQLSLAAYLLARACLRDDRLRDLGRGLAAVWSRSSGVRPDPEFLAHLDSELAAAEARDCGVDPRALADAGFA